MIQTGGPQEQINALSHRGNGRLLEDCAKDGVEDFFSQYPGDIEEVIQSSHSKFIMSQSIMVKKSCWPSLAQMFILGHRTLHVLRSAELQFEAKH